MKTLEHFEHTSNICEYEQKSKTFAAVFVSGTQLINGTISMKTIKNCGQVIFFSVVILAKIYGKPLYL